MKKKLLHLVLAGISGVTLGAVADAASFNLLNIDINRAMGVAKDVGTAASPLAEKDEIALGRELAGRTMGAAPLINDRRLQSYVNQVGKQIAAQSTRPDLPWRFGVIDSPGINAFASPGGIILITRGLYEILDNEAQLAGIIGHEIAHVAKFHHANVVRQQAAVSAGKGVAQELTSQRAGVLAPALNLALGSGAELFAKKLDRGAELDADNVGADLAVKAGYSPAGLIDVLHKLNARSSEPTTKLLYATHPHPTERLTALGDALAPKMASLPEGTEPPLQVAASGLPAPVRTAGQPTATGSRGFSDQTHQPSVQQEAGSASSLTGQGGSNNPASALPEAAQQLLRGLFGR